MIFTTVRSILREWVDRRKSHLTIRLDLSGHGCFGRYLHKIARKEATTVCSYSGAAADTALHTLPECPTRDESLTTAVELDLSLSDVVKSMISSDKAWKAMITFYKTVMTSKEPAERGEKPKHRQRQSDIVDVQAETSSIMLIF
ncbi:unnamed protein product [Euphydryas editha]|uniref:Uncharacterized protein n=1 Tax=Euphydryas editha TaxID=104508 RepID=A0AAU9UW77_EUPED|nr:unnamed protein product [Euphydryas editha]